MPSGLLNPMATILDSFSAAYSVNPITKHWMSGRQVKVPIDRKAPENLRSIQIFRAALTSIASADGKIAVGI
jgi:hypothetical protein